MIRLSQIIILSTVLLFLCFRGHKLLAQETSLRFGINGSAYSGRAKLDWNTDIITGDYTVYKKWSEKSRTIGCNAFFVKAERHLLGVIYEFQETNIHDYDLEFAKSIKQHHLLAAYSEEESFSDGEYSKFIRIYGGLNLMKAKDLTPYLLRFSSPYSFNSNWRGLIYGLDIGFGANFGKKGYSLNFFLSIKFSRLLLSEARWDVDDKQLNAGGNIRSRTIGIGIGLSRQIKIALNKKVQ